MSPPFLMSASMTCFLKYAVCKKLVMTDMPEPGEHQHYLKAIAFFTMSGLSGALFYCAQLISTSD